MSTVSWNARDQLGRVIEVTSDTVADVPSPGPESLAVGGEQTIRLLEFPFSFDDSFVNDDYTVVHTVTTDCYIVYSAFITLTAWAGAGVAEMSWEGVRDGQQTFIEATDVAAGGSQASFPREFPPSSRFAMPFTAGQTIGIGVWPAGEVTSGTAKLMVLIAEPAA